MTSLATVLDAIKLLQKQNYIYLSLFISFVSMIFDAISLIMIYELITALENNSSYIVLEKLSMITSRELPQYAISYWAAYVGVVVLLANFIRAFNIKLIIDITYNSELKINECMFERKILGPYSRFIDENQFDDHKEILTEARIVVQGIMSFTFVCLGVFQILGIMAGLILTDPQSSLTLLSIVTLIYLITLAFLITPIKTASLVRSESDTNRISLLSEALANIKQIKVGRDEHLILNRLFDYAKIFHNANAKAKWLAVLPRYIIEGGILSGIAFLIAILLFNNGPIQLPSLASITLLAVAASRLIPAAQKIYNGFVTIGFSDDATRRLNKKLQDLLLDKATFKHNEAHTDEPFLLTARDIKYKYTNTTNPIIENLSFTFASGRLNFIVGESGTGKSTLCDLIIGLLPCNSGSIQFMSKKNDKQLFPILRYIPQDSLLLTGTVAQNLLDTNTVSRTQLLRAQQLIINFRLADNEIDAKKFLNSEVKEFGRNFSGGQRQRLSIIRGLLQDANVLVLDESFSALDHRSALSALGELEKVLDPNILIIIITHDISLIRDRDFLDLAALNKQNKSDKIRV